MPAGLAALALAVAFWQEPGKLSFDTKAQLHLSPGRFLADVLSVWTPTTDLGHVWAGQYVGYAFPMGPFFALGHLAGLPDWVVQRLWLGALLAVAAWGAVRLLDALLDRPRGLAHVIAGAALIANPYVAVLANRASVTLIAYALLPWLLLAAHRGVHAPRSWWWPAATALLVAATAPGVNAAVTAWVLVGPVLLALYEPLLGHVRPRAVWSFAWRCAVLGVLASLWWVVPAMIQSSHGLNFLQFVEQPGTVWGTTSASEALRLMAYWHSYTGVGLSGHAVPLLGTSPPLLFSRPVVLASLLIPAAALGSFAWTRRWRYGPFFVVLVIAGVGITMAGFPEGTPLRHGLYFVYNRVAGIQFLRTSQKAAPLIAVGLAVLLGTGVAEAARRWRRPLAGPVLCAGVAVLLALAAWPLTRGDAIGLTSRGVPAAWRSVAGDIDRSLPANTRAVVLPGQLFGFYDWGGFGDPVLPAITKRPVAVRAIVPYADLHAMDALWTVDRLVGQQRLLPGELRPMLGLLGAGWVVTGADDDRNLSGGPDPARAARVLAAQGLGRPAAAYGPRRAFPAPTDAVGSPQNLPEVRRYTLAPGRGIVRVEPAARPTFVDGSAAGLGQLASLGALPAHGVIRYAADLPATQLRSAAAAGGASIVISDSNRRRVFANSRPRQNLGATLALGDPISADSAQLDPFSGRADAQTIAVLHGARYVRAPYSPALSLFPEHRPFAAFDDDPRTAWIADRALDPARRWVEIGFTAPRDVGTIDVVPADDPRGVVRQVVVAGRTFPVHPGHNLLRLGLHHVSALRIAIPHVVYPPTLNGGAGGLYSVSIPGVHVTEALRLPVVAERALAGAPLAADDLTYLLSRTTGDDPLHRARAHGPWQAAATVNAGDAETSWHRLLSPPAARHWSADGWLSVSPLASDALLDRLAGYRGPVRATSSGRFADTGAYRASSAFDGDPQRPWVGERLAGHRPWLAWRVRRRVTIRRLRLVAPRLEVATPAVVALRWPGGSTGPLTVAGDGVVRLPAPARARAFRLTVLRSRFGSVAARARRAVAIGELRGAGVPRLEIRRRGPLPAACGIAGALVGGRRVPLALRASISDLDGARSLRAVSCGPPVALPAGPSRLDVPDGPLRVDVLRLRSPRTAPAPAARPGGGRVLAPGSIHRASVTGVRVAVAGPSWLVLGESFDRGWRATCDGRSLGAPVVIDAFANGWPVDRGCARVAFTYAPQHTALLAEIVSGLIALLLLIGLVARPAPQAERLAAAELPVADRPARLAPAQAAALALAAGVVLGFGLSIRAGIVIAIGAFLVLWLGIGARRLVIAAFALLAVGVPAAYLLTGVRNHGGWDFNYAVERIDGHWVAVGALVALLGAVARTIAQHRSSIAGRS